MLFVNAAINPGDACDSFQGNKIHKLETRVHLTMAERKEYRAVMLRNTEMGQVCRVLRDKIEAGVKRGVFNSNEIVSHRLFFEELDPVVLAQDFEDGNTCSICLQPNNDMSIKSLNCGDIFHENCLKLCMENVIQSKKLECPNCRQNFIRVRKKAWVNNGSPTASLSIPTPTHNPNRIIDYFKRLTASLSGCFNSSDAIDINAYTNLTVGIAY
jgi:hypothetical protein